MITHPRHRRPVVSYTTTLVLMAFTLALTSTSPKAAQRPNVILVMTDDQGYGDLGCHGNTMIRTPNLDRLHQQSVRLTNFHVDPTCTQTRAALMTGRYSTRSGAWHTIAGRSLLAHDEVTLADLFRASGYRTGIFGKWHLGDNYPMRPQDRGFDEVVVHGGGGITQTPDYWGNTYFDDTYFHNGQPQKYDGYCTDVFFDQALRFVQANRDRPFFLYLPTNVPHGPFNVEERYEQYYRERGVPPTMAKFYGMIENFDENMGRLSAKLREWELEENTLVIFMTDNGTAAGVARAQDPPESWQGFNAAMRGNKGSQYEGGHRVPCFLRWPSGKLRSGHDLPQLTAHFDLLPTLIELCNLKPNTKLPLDGTSLVPLLRTENPAWPERTLFAHVQRQEIPPKWIRSAVMTQQWRLIDGESLYDLANDPGQQTDLASSHPQVVTDLRARYERWWSSLTPAFERFNRIVIGADPENPSRITCHDWHSNRGVPWNQGMIRKAPWLNGHWMIQIAQTGTYTFTLRQQPTIAAFPIQADHARIRVGEHEAECPVRSGATSVTLTLDLQAGPARLETWLTDVQAEKSRGAFFIEAKRLD